MSEQAIVPVKESSESDVEVHPAVHGRQRKEWKLIGTDELCEGEDLRRGAQRWLRAKEIPHKTLTKSSNKGATTLIGRCSACKECSKQWCFSLVSGSLHIETCGQCSGEKDVDRLRRFYARRFAKEHTPANALKAMRKAGIEPEHRPKAWQVKNQRPKKVSTQGEGASIACLGDLKAFVSSPPDGVYIYTEECICEEGRVLIAFSLQQAVDKFMDKSKVDFGTCLLDWTFKTNSHGLLLGSIGPCGLVLQKHGPSMRFLPTIFLVSSKEDEPAQHLAVRLYFSQAEKWGIHVTHGIFDCSVYYGVASYTAEHFPHVNVRRCLQHAKTNARAAAAGRDKASGKTLLGNGELLDVILEWLQFTATLPSDEEFHAFWSSCFARMEGKSAPTDFGEKKFAKYLKKNLFNDSGPLWTAPWCCGLGLLPPGITTFAPNSIEVQHRVLKGLLAPGYERRDVGSLMVEVCESLASRLESGTYDKLVTTLAEPWDELSKASSRRLKDSIVGDDVVTKTKARRLDRDKIVAHYQEAGPRNTFLASTCEKQLRTGEVAKLCYVMGKHQLSYAKDKPRDMQACMQLALAETSADIQDACRSPKTGAYCLHRHAYLRQAFVTIYVTSQRHVLDTHKDYLTGAGWTEHTLFISALIQDKAFLSPVCQGPSNSRPKKSPKKKKNVQKSERTKAMLAAPELVAGEDCPQANKAPLRRVSLSQLLPGLPAAQEAPAFLSCEGALLDEAKTCMAPTTKGCRCRRPRSQGNFCKQHFLEFSDQDRQDALWEGLEPIFQKSAEEFDEAQVKMGVELSLKDMQEHAEQLQASRALVAQRLRQEGCERIDTEADGNCFFISLSYTAGLEISPQSLRAEVCAYLRSFPQTFSDWFDTFFKSYDDYVRNLSRDGVYADDLCCLASAHLLLRPLRIISDMPDDHIVEFNPPASIDPSACGPPVTLAFYLKGRHYEATQPLKADEPLPKRMKREKQP